MRKLLLTSLAATLAFALPQLLLGQSGTNPFPWRANNGQVPVYQSSTGLSANGSVTPPILRTNGAVNSLRQDDQKPAAGADQKAQDYSFGDVPTPTQSGTYQNEPGLSVQSNAIAENGQCCQNGCSDIGCPKRFFGSHCCGPQIGGWAQMGYHSENTILFNDRADNLELHQFWLFAHKATNANNNFGYRIDTVYGIDGQNLQAVGNPPTGNPTGWDNSWDFGAYGWAVPQAYLEYGDGQMTVRAGKFLSPFGIEKAPSIENFFYSRTYTRVLTEPFSHTGIIGERKQGNRSFILGATAGWDTGFDGSGGFNVITGVRQQLNSNVSIQATSSLGDTGVRGSGTLNSVVANVKLLPNVDWGVQADVLDLNLNNNNEFGLINYLMYRQNDHFGLGARLEWWKSDRIFPGPNPTKSTWAATFGANIRPHTNILIRPEVRFDWGAAAIDPGEAILGIDATLIF